LPLPKEGLPVHHQDLLGVHFGEDLEEGFLELLGVQAVHEQGDGGVARGLAEAEVGQKMGVGAGKTFHAPQGVHAGKEGHQDEG